MFLRRLLTLILGASLSVFFLFSLFNTGSWRRRGPSKEQIASGHNILPDLRANNADYRAVFKEPKIENKSPYPIGETKPPGSTYTKCLVVPKLRVENTSWIEEELGDLIETGVLTTAVYSVNDREAKLQPPKNKGHEVMVYLTYIIDNYHDLPDVSIFMHAHRFAWHNNELLDKDAALMVRNLSPERVTREGYFNMRCHWDPGCPEWLYPSETEQSDEKPEQHLLARAWAQLFPLDPVPSVLAQPCCAQFAVSRLRILMLPKTRYVYMRDWLLRTELSDYLSGRVFEHLWQYVFSKTPVHCPSMHACYCDGYGLCFGGAEAFDKWFELRYYRNKLREELRLWEEKTALVEAMRAKGELVDDALLHAPDVGKGEKLKRRIEALSADLEDRRLKALELGRDPQARAVASERKWRVGDGF